MYWLRRGRPVAYEYRAVINLDFAPSLGGYDANNYLRLLAALEHAGWYYVETSAMAYDGDLDGVRRGLQLLAHGLGFPGIPSALTVQVQLVGEPRDVPGNENGALWAPRILDETIPGP